MNRVDGEKSIEKKNDKRKTLNILVQKLYRTRKIYERIEFQMIGFYRKNGT